MLRYLTVSDDQWMMEISNSACLFFSRGIHWNFWWSPGSGCLKNSTPSGAPPESLSSGWTLKVSSAVAILRYPPVWGRHHSDESEKKPPCLVDCPISSYLILWFSILEGISPARHVWWHRCGYHKIYIQVAIQVNGRSNGPVDDAYRGNFMVCEWDNHGIIMG